MSRTQTSPDLFPKGFASDNFAGAHPRVLAAIAACNDGHATAYGDDPITARAREAFNDLFGRPVSTHFVFNGTGANLTALMAFAKSYGAVLCSETAHIVNDESTAPERLLGMRITPVASKDGKIDPAALEEVMGRGHGVNSPRPVALTLTQPTEIGTLYTQAELRTLIDLAHAHGLGVHVDGARLGCAVAATGVDVRTMLADVDAVSFGGTKQGMVFGEAVVFLKPGLCPDYPYYQKHATQLPSKMRYVSAQFEALLENDLWIENGRRANAAARSLETAVRPFPFVEVAFPVQANGVFARIPKELVAPLQAESFFWPWDERTGLVRWMCSWDSTQEDIDAFVTILKHHGCR